MTTTTQETNASGATASAPRAVSAAEFLDELLPSGADGAAPCIFVMRGARHIWARVDRTLGHCAAGLAGHEGIYFTPGTYLRQERKASAASRFRAFWLDIDAGPEKHARDPEHTYPTQLDALTAIKAFIKASGLKPSYLVDSGAGWHVYYLLEHPISAEQWKPLAERLKAYCISRGLKIDPTCTADAARVMRLPGSKHKNGKGVRAWCIA